MMALPALGFTRPRRRSSCHLMSICFLAGLFLRDVQAGSPLDEDHRQLASSFSSVNCRLLELDTVVEHTTADGPSLSDRKGCICVTEDDDQLLPITAPENMNLHRYCKDDTTVIFSNAQIIQQQLVVQVGSSISIVDNNDDSRRKNRYLAQMQLTHKDDGNIFDGNNGSNGNNNFGGSGKTMGIKSVLLVRVSTVDRQPAISANEFQRRVMSSSGFSMADQYKQCSFGKLQFELANGQDVIDLELDQDIWSYKTNLQLMGAAQQKIKKLFNVDDIQSITDHVMFCFPPGLEGDWVAFAGVGDYRSAFRDQYCGTLSVSMHEVGHNLGLRHSNENGDYLDVTGYMGVGRDVQNYPLKCFNAEKNWNLGWYNDRAIKINPMVDGPQMIQLAAFVDYDKIPEDQYVLINVDDKYFVQYNRAKGMNSETEEKRNQVVIVERRNGDNDKNDKNSEMLDGIVRHYNQKDMAFGPYDNDSAVVFHICENLQNDVVLISIGINESLCGQDDGTPFYQEMMENVGTWSAAVRKRRDRPPKGGVKQQNGGDRRRGIRGR